MRSFICNDVSQLNIKINQSLKDLLEYRVICLNGEMGAGKTTFTSQFASILGSLVVPSSPTFSIVNIYPLASQLGNITHIVHMDLYRLQSHLEIIENGLNEYWEDPQNFVIIEWPNLGIPYIKDNYTQVNIIVKPFQVRHFEIIKHTIN